MSIRAIAGFLVSPFILMGAIFAFSTIFLTEKQRHTNQRLEKLVGDVRKLHKTHETLAKGHNQLTGGVDGLSDIIEGQHEKLVEIERFSSQRNVHVTGIPERRDENPENMIRELFSKKLKVDFDVKDIESAVRLGLKSEEGPREIVVKFANFKDKKKCLETAHLLDGSPYMVNDAL
ncbi:unnamed protein product [Oikopleura dioica]|uniref:Uncharacterized protein n=1 Tax=Oikopleura dioica TaxID=34765 RepID=E4XGV0_OIKDI|nr:unnamed protein product [Oikopleura dioica]